MIPVRKWLLREFIFLFVSDAHDAIFTRDFNNGKKDTYISFFVAANDEGVDVSVLDDIAEFICQFCFGRFFPFQENEVFCRDDEGEVRRIRVTRGRVDGTSGEFDLAVWLDELTTHHEKDEELKNHVDERGHVDPCINTSFAGDEHDLGAGEKTLTKV